MKYTVSLLLILTCFGFTILFEEGDVKLTIQELLEDYNKKSLQERLFVHIDNNLVEPGNNIWMKAYLTERKSNRPSTLSNVLYTDILTHKGDKLLGYKFRLDSGRADGAIYIPDSLKYENYILSAYTQEMSAYGEAFTQVIEVRAYKSLFQVCEVKFDKDLYQSGDPIDISIRTMDINKKPIGKVKYEYKLYNQGVVIRDGSGKTDKEGIAEHQLSLDKNQYVHKPILEVTTSFDDKQSNFYFNVPVVVKKELVVAFFPESKVMLEGVQGRVGIRVRDMEGIPINFRGSIMDNQDFKVTDIQIKTNGIGSASFTPEPGKSYYLKIPGLDQKYDLPKTQKQGYALYLQESGAERIKFNVTRSAGTDTLVHVALISGGKVGYFERLDLEDEQEVTIPVAELERGIAEFCLFDRYGKRLINRCVFVNNGQLVDFDFDFSSKYNKIGEEVELAIKARDGEGNPITGDFSLSITEDFSVFHKTFKQSNIISRILLESAVSSRLQNRESFLAGDIFSGDNINDALLVLNYKWDDWNKKQATIEVDRSNREVLQGLVLNHKNAPQAGVDIVAVVKGAWDRSIITSDDFGFFTLPVSLLSEENRGFIIGIANDSEAKNLKIRIKGVDYVPRAVEGLSFPLLMAEQEVFDGTEGFSNAKILPDLTVEDESYTQLFLDKKVQNYGSFSSTVKKGDQLRQGQNFLDILRQVTSVARADMPVPGNIIFRGVPKIAGGTFGGGGTPALFVLDGVPLGNNYHDLDYIRVEHIESINVIRSASAVINYGTRASGGVVVVTTGMTKDVMGQKLLTQQKLEQNLLNNLERAVSVDFFEPRRTFKNEIDTTEFSMLKSTLYWSPNLTFDENGVAIIRYRNLDLPSKVMIRINGVSADHKLGFREQSYFSTF